MIGALLWLAAGAGAVSLVEDAVTAPAGGWRPVSVTLRQRPAVIDCEFQVQRGGRVRLWLLDSRDLANFRTGRALEPLAVTGYQTSGRLRYNAGLGDFALVVDNRMSGREEALVRLRVALDFAAGQVREAPAGRRAAVVGLSLAFFCAVSYWAARRLGPLLAARLRE